MLCLENFNDIPFVLYLEKNQHIYLWILVKFWWLSYFYYILGFNEYNDTYLYYPADIFSNPQQCYRCWWAFVVPHACTYFQTQTSLLFHSWKSWSTDMSRLAWRSHPDILLIESKAFHLILIIFQSFGSNFPFNLNSSYIYTWPITIFQYLSLSLSVFYSLSLTISLYLYLYSHICI